MLNFWRHSMPAFEQANYLVIDLEMTGLDAQTHSIVSTGTVLIQHGHVQLNSAQHRFFLPSALMGDDVSDSVHIHKITDFHREQLGEPLQPWLQWLFSQTVDAWVFHHAQIDKQFIAAAAEACELKLPKQRIIDTLAIERKHRNGDLLDSQSQLSLAACCARYNLPPRRTHHALSDALATAELFLAQHHHWGES